MLFDAGPGIRDIRPVADSLTDLPITFVPSHFHYDHLGPRRNVRSAWPWSICPGCVPAPPTETLALTRAEHLGFVEDVATPTLKVTEWLEPGSRTRARRPGPAGPLHARAHRGLHLPGRRLERAGLLRGLPLPGPSLRLPAEQPHGRLPRGRECGHRRRPRRVRASWGPTGVKPPGVPVLGPAGRARSPFHAGVHPSRRDLRRRRLPRDLPGERSGHACSPSPAGCSAGRRRNEPRR